MPPYFRIDFICLLISLIISTSFLVMVFSAAPKRHENQIFSLFALVEILWNISAICLRLSLISKSSIGSVPIIGEPQTWFRFTSIFIGLMCLLSLYFVTVFLKIKSKIINWYLLSGLLLMIVLNLNVSPKAIVDTRFNSMGLVTDTVKLFGWIAIVFFTSYIFSAIVLILKHKIQHDITFIGLGFSIIYIGLIFGGALNFFISIHVNFQCIGSYNYWICHTTAANP